MANRTEGKNGGLLYARLYQGVTLGNVWPPQFCTQFFVNALFLQKKLKVTVDNHKKQRKPLILNNKNDWLKIDRVVLMRDFWVMLQSFLLTMHRFIHRICGKVSRPEEGRHILGPKNGFVMTKPGFVWRFCTS